MSLCGDKQISWVWGNLVTFVDSTDVQMLNVQTSNSIVSKPLIPDRAEKQEHESMSLTSVNCLNLHNM